MEVIQGGFKKGVWQCDRETFSDEDIEVWNDRLRQLSLQHPWLEEFGWDIQPTQKQPLNR
jgi:hypothetical protein